MYIMHKRIVLRETGKIVGTGWIPSLPDLRDYTEKHPKIIPMAEKLGTVKARKPSVTRVDLRKWCSPIEDQKELNSCSANAAVGMVEYFENRAFGKHIDGSRLFVYKTTRNLMGVVGDFGAYLRTTMGALALCGVPPEKYWPYTDKDPDFDREPPSFVYAIAENFEAVKYFRHDAPGESLSGDEVLSQVKKYLEAGVLSMFGFFVFPSIRDSDIEGGIPYPCQFEASDSGHAVVAVGYDDAVKIKNLQCDRETTGALMIRNSWGTDWGDEGYGWLPYDYVLNGLAWDFWSLLSMDWVETGQFGIAT